MAGLVLLSACGGGEPTGQDTLNVPSTEDSTAQAERMRKTRNIFYNIPSPMETAALLKKAGAEYDKDILNDVQNVDKYTAASKQALNLGIYGADLSYASVNNQTQESMFFTSCAKKLADRLGVSNAFDDATLERMEKNMNNRDSLLSIISETYWTVDAYLKENERDNISALMIAGGWVEGLYIATQVSRVKATPELKQRIAEQKLSLHDLLGLMETYEGTDEALASVKADLTAIAALFEGVAEPAASAEVTQENGVALIGAASANTTLSDDQLRAITEKASTVRNAYIN
ncbi:MAG: hypothetical protein IPH53_10310 [Flavobacteriales bacterium]|nr:hypothetical protein [Flavobacteriales bacterium]MBK7085026.1 hypothetical protein [Flavobacteriales bacterium]MBK7269731.1 hypothetical protein [Flavobacteriales bacterium]MBK7752570.1 hypothetical protein [Flavobacteriales bacterium]MBK9076759.1 hypothetical protein [Flavobacteriales bacterium]